MAILLLKRGFILKNLYINSEKIPLEEYEKRIIIYYIEEGKDLKNFFKKWSNLKNNNSLNLFVPELHELFNVILIIYN